MPEGGEKTEQATPQALRKARERGEVAKSTELSAAALLLTAFGVITWQLESIGAGFGSMAERTFKAATETEPNTAVMLNAFADAIQQAVGLVLPLIVALVAVAMLVPFLQVGAIITFEPLKPSLKKLNPISGLKKMFFSLSTYVELLKGIAKLTVIFLIVWNIIQQEIATILMLGMLPLEAVVAQSVRIIGRCVMYIIMFFAAIAVLDLFYQRWQYAKNMRMSKEQVKQEYKQQEGDPTNKSARKRLHQEILRDAMVLSTAKADVVVTNPTHIACALRYDPDEEASPRLVAKGNGYIAEQIKQVAKDNDIPIVRDVGLARALQELELDTEVPEELYDGVAEILKWVEMVAMSQGETPKWLRDSDTKDEVG